MAPLGASGLLNGCQPGGAAAATFSRPADYETYQVKGRASLRAASEADEAIARTYCRDTLAALLDLGVAPGLVEHWQATRDLVVASPIPDAVFVQTPGPRAGPRLGGLA